MTEPTKADYHARRAAQEREVAAKADDKAVRRIHRQLSELHTSEAQRQSFVTLE